MRVTVQIMLESWTNYREKTLMKLFYGTSYLPKIFMDDLPKRVRCLQLNIKIEQTQSNLEYIIQIYIRTNTERT